MSFAATRGYHACKSLVMGGSAFLLSIEKMSGNSLNKTSRLVQWIINDFNSSSEQSTSFRIGDWTWNLTLDPNKKESIVIRLKPELYGECLIASFNLRLFSFRERRETRGNKEIREQLFNSDKATKAFAWTVWFQLRSRFMIEVEFLDIKSASQNGGEPRSIWSERCIWNETATYAFGKMLSESIHTDITILASDGSIGAHRAVLAAHSPVFASMFIHDLKEKDLSSINIPDMSIAVCQAFLDYLYSNEVQYQDFLIHRLDLLKAADKYDVTELIDACQESLIEDIDSKNVLERLQTAFTYRLPRLKVSCIEYLVKFGKVFDIKEEFKRFRHNADKELVSEVVDEIFSAWKGII